MQNISLLGAAAKTRTCLGWGEVLALQKPERGDQGGKEGRRGGESAGRNEGPKQRQAVGKGCLGEREKQAQPRRAGEKGGKNSFFLGGKQPGSQPGHRRRPSSEVGSIWPGSGQPRRLSLGPSSGSISRPPLHTGGRSQLAPAETKWTALQLGRASPGWRSGRGGPASEAERGGGREGRGQS